MKMNEERNQRPKPYHDDDEKKPKKKKWKKIKIV